MGCDCINYFPKGTRSADVEEFLMILGFKKGKKGLFSGNFGKPFNYYVDDHYRHITGVYSELYWDPDDRDQLCLWTRTTIWRSKFDSDFHNFTIKQIKKRFGGHFKSDFGKNRYFKFEGPVREKAEAGALAAYSRFHRNINRAERMISFSNLLDDSKYEIHGIDFVDSLNPRIVSTNVLVPFVVAAIEDYFRSLYIALLKYSDKRDKIFQRAKLSGSELPAIAYGELSVAEAVAKWMTFQDLSKVNQAMKEIDDRYDIHGMLKKPHGRAKESHWNLLERLIEQRHALIHHAELDSEYLPIRFKRDLKRVETAVWRIYQELIRLNSWEPVDKSEV